MAKAEDIKVGARIVWAGESMVVDKFVIAHEGTWADYERSRGRVPGQVILGSGETWIDEERASHCEKTLARYWSATMADGTEACFGPEWLPLIEVLDR